MCEFMFTHYMQFIKSILYESCTNKWYLNDVGVW